MARLTNWICVVVLAVLLCHLQMSAACTCLERHPQNQFCKSDFVFLVKVKGSSSQSARRNIFEKFAYNVSVIKIFKATPEAQTVLNETEVLLWTSAPADACGLFSLRPDTIWVIGGSLSHGDLHVTICDIAIEWRKVSSIQQEYFHKSYQRTCSNCRVSNDGLRSAGSKTCFWDNQSKSRHYCEQHYSICMMNCKGCSWMPSLYFNHCLTMQ